MTTHSVLGCFTYMVSDMLAVIMTLACSTLSNLTSCLRAAAQQPRPGQPSSPGTMHRPQTKPPCAMQYMFDIVHHDNARPIVTMRLQVWLQEFAWSEKGRRQKLQARERMAAHVPQLLTEPIFCFETAVRMLYWCAVPTRLCARMLVCPTNAYASLQLSD
jgi:hypothetical protein